VIDQGTSRAPAERDTNDDRTGESKYRSRISRTCWPLQSTSPPVMASSSSARALLETGRLTIAQSRSLVRVANSSW
jgi:hypothetical protein